MPVRGVSDHPTIPRLGKIRLGYRDEAKRGAPVNTPYFVCPDEVKAIYGEEPVELKIVFLSDDPELNASTYLRAYNATSGLICKGDGYTADALLDADELRRSGGELNVNAWAHGDTRGDASKSTANFVHQQIHCAGGGYEGQPPCAMFAAKKCSLKNFIQFAIKDVPGIGIYQMDTGSLISTRQIDGAIKMAGVMFGGIRGVPCILRRVKKDVAPDGKRKGVWMVELEVDTTYSLSNLIELRSGPIARLLLPPVDESEVYGPVDDDEEAEPYHNEVKTAAELAAARGATQEPASPPSTDGSAPPATPPVRDAAESASPVDLLYELEKKYGLPAKQQGIAVMARLFDTTVVTSLSTDDRADLAEVLRFRLKNPEHGEHELAYSAKGRPICRLCGDAISDAEPAQQGALVT